MTNASHAQLTICGLEELDAHSARSVTHVLSILDPGWPEPEAFFAYDPHHRTTLHFHDEIEPRPGVQLPKPEHVEQILAFGRSLQRDLVERPDAHLLVHCHAGISRSTAAMTALLAQADPGLAEEAIFERLLAVRPKAWPNSLMIGFADDQLSRGGRLTQALRHLYGKRLAGRPELAKIMHDLNRVREVEMAVMPG
ncbi:Predicted protein tyrosine phosphatase [Rhizobiales bacterium GAS188]|nr:Predicted protein tyrosine phosphatase [Rhizobiales bacterium GAS188]